MTAVRELIWVEIEQRLIGQTSAVEVEFMPTGDPSRYPALGIDEDPQAVDPNTEPGVNRYIMRVVVDGFVTADSIGDCRPLANNLYAEVVAALMTDDMLSGLVEEINEGPLRMQVAQLADTPRLGFSVEFEIIFPAAKHNPSL